MASVAKNNGGIKGRDVILRSYVTVTEGPDGKPQLGGGARTNAEGVLTGAYWEIAAADGVQKEDQAEVAQKGVKYNPWFINKPQVDKEGQPVLDAEGRQYYNHGTYVPKSTTDKIIEAAKALVPDAAKNVLAKQPNGEQTLRNMVMYSEPVDGKPGTTCYVIKGKVDLAIGKNGIYIDPNGTFEPSPTGLPNKDTMGNMFAEVKVENERRKEAGLLKAPAAQRTAADTIRQQAAAEVAQPEQPQVDTAAEINPF